MGYGFWADVIVAIHVGYVCFIFFGQLAILAGAHFRWGWVRNFWFRLIHLVAIGIVAVEAIFNVTCPLTAWEADLRQLAGQSVKDSSFIGRWLNQLIFLDASPLVLNILHVAIGLVILATFWLIPPRFPWRRMPAALTPNR